MIDALPQSPPCALYQNLRASQCTCSKSTRKQNGPGGTSRTQQQAQAQLRETRHTSQYEDRDHTAPRPRVASKRTRFVGDGRQAVFFYSRLSPFSVGSLELEEPSGSYKSSLGRQLVIVPNCQYNESCCARLQACNGTRRARRYYGVTEQWCR